MFKDIPGYDGKYQINECGNIINYKAQRPKIVRPAISPTGYLRCVLQKDDCGYRQNESIHRLVAETFIPNPDNLPVVMHLDNDKLNNHVSNLKWGTYKDNSQQAVADGLYENCGPAKQRYQVYKEDNSHVINCEGYQGVCDLIQYRIRTICNIVSHNTKINLGPYAGYKIRKVQKLYKVVGEDKENLQDATFNDYPLVRE